MDTLGDVLREPDRLPWGEWVIFRPDEPLTAATPCRVEDLDDLPDDLDYPPEAVAAGLTTSLDTATVQDIVSNLLQQVDEAGMDLRLRAFAYYWEYDAFIDLDVTGPA